MAKANPCSLTEAHAPRSEIRFRTGSNLIWLSQSIMTPLRSDQVDKTLSTARSRPRSASTDQELVNSLCPPLPNPHHGGKVSQLLLLTHLHRCQLPLARAFQPASGTRIGQCAFVSALLSSLRAVYRRDAACPLYFRHRRPNFST